jgi:hypothetical protein
MKETLKKLLENKKQIDSAFVEMLVKLEFLNEQKKAGIEEDYEKWFNTAVNEYMKIKCDGCCEQELEECSAC